MPFFSQVIRFGALLREDIDTVLDRDPAARTALEVALCYPGVHAVWCHRVAHWLWQWPAGRLPARCLAHWARIHTGVEIHPGAVMGRRCFIDHGMGVVIGETALIGHDVTLYQGVTLGGTGKETTRRRHPRLDNGVMVGAGAILLGGITVGEGAIVGASSVVLKSVAAHTTVVGVPAHTVSGPMADNDDR
jgi:serine O-acetyltransferase